MVSLLRSFKFFKHLPRSLARLSAAHPYPRSSSVDLSREIKGVSRGDQRAQEVAAGIKALWKDKNFISNWAAACCSKGRIPLLSECLRKPVDSDSNWLWLNWLNSRSNPFIQSFCSFHGWGPWRLSSAVGSCCTCGVRRQEKHSYSWKSWIRCWLSLRGQMRTHASLHSMTFHDQSVY